MAQNLRLKSQKYSAKESFAYAVDVLVDTGISHLSEPFTYAVDEKHGNLNIGSIVSVPFGSRLLFGLVIKVNSDGKNGLKFIKKVVHLNPVVTQEQIDLIYEAKERWTGTFWNYLKFAVPNIPAKIQIPKIENLGIKRKIEGPELRIGTEYSDLDLLISNRINPGRQILIVVPELDLLMRLKKTIANKYVEYGSHLSAQQRVENYLEILRGNANVILGTRSSIFLPLKSDAEILIIDDLSFSFYESRYPFWNVRDLALMRAAKHSLTFYTHSPSLELIRLTEIGWMRMRQKKAQRLSIFFRNSRFSYQTVVKNGLKKGKVLILVPDKGYINALVCAKCRNLYSCKNCGGRLIQLKANSGLTCQLCYESKKYLNCDFCNSDRLLSFGKGIDRTLEELGKQFPNTQIIKYQEERDLKNGSIILANYSNFPISEFKSIIVLGFEKFGYQNRLRSSELARKLLFDLRALSADEYFIDLEDSDYFAQVLLNGDAYKSGSKELSERTIVKLPPEYRLAIVECDAKSISIFQEQSFIESVSYSSGRALLKVKVNDGHKLSSFLHGIANYRSLRKLKPWNIKVDPLDI